MSETTLQPDSGSINESNYKKALKRLSRLEKQNAFLIDELVKSRQCLLQMKMEREIILDRVADNLIIEDYDWNGDEEDEDISDISEDDEASNTTAAAVLKRKRELVDELADKAESDEAFAKVLSELSGYQPLESRGKKGSGAAAASTGIAANATIAASATGAKKRSRPTPATSGSRFNRLSALTQAMRTGIISDDEGGSKVVNLHQQQNQLIDPVEDYEDEHFDGEEAELAQLKKVRTSANANASVVGAVNIASSQGTPIKEDSQVLKVIPVPYDAEGHPILPLSLNMITVHRLGEVVYDRPGYHNKRYILPVGFTTSRSYLSVLSPEGSINYFSTILDNGPAPLYQVTPEGHPEMTFQSASTTGAWAAVSKAAAAIRGKDSAPSVSGPDYFGLANSTVSMLIEKLPNADKCESYIPKKYEVSNLVGGKGVKNTLNVSGMSAVSSANNTMIDNNDNTNIMNSNDNTNNTNNNDIEIDAFDIHQSYM